ncbi:two-component sensor histidine kinase [Amycolatopsis balhimycina DSM 5908]|uniref:Two-component sensor histidine kinase n=1 Tax=Amycolatopsis balhimycina DSM 5908 TaxID=1081091 RepID=A0A428WP71_AMYBA|nr:histidine kinase [Amycolatopsis balhimycina]RSM44895.1 two-component sensor histidine kinase [Amycolatopsis balhimycina DSM 5908]
MARSGNPHPGGLFILLPVLLLPAYAATDSPAGDVPLDVIALGVFAALFTVSQWLTPAHPLALRLGLAAALAGVAASGMWALNRAWLAAAVLTAVACANLLPLMFGAILGVAATAGLTAVTDGKLIDVVMVVAGGAIALLRGRLLVEIGRSRANRQAYATAAVENERLRFARDLHDLLGHSLVTMMAKAELAERLAAVDPARAAAAARDVREVGRTAVTEVQRVVTGYRSTSLAEEIEHARRSLEPLQVEITVSIPDRTWQTGIDTVLAWGVREAVANVLRHSNANRCAITVTVERRSIRLDVVNDDSGGTLVDIGSSGGHGLVGLRERAAELGGRLTAGPRQGGGYRFTMELPIEERA